MGGKEGAPLAGHTLNDDCLGVVVLCVVATCMVARHGTSVALSASRAISFCLCGEHCPCGFTRYQVPGARCLGWGNVGAFVDKDRLSLVSSLGCLVLALGIQRTFFRRLQFRIIPSGRLEFWIIQRHHPDWPPPASRLKLLKPFFSARRPLIAPAWLIFATLIISNKLVTSTCVCSTQLGSPPPPIIFLAAALPTSTGRT